MKIDDNLASLFHIAVIIWENMLYTVNIYFTQIWKMYFINNNLIYLVQVVIWLKYDDTLFS